MTSPATALQRAVDRHREGEMRFAQGDFAGAAACYREALAAKPDHFPSYSGLGASLLRQGDDKAAMALFDEATARDPANRRRYVILATDSYRRSLPFDREHLPAHLNIGLGFAEQGALDAAVEQYRRLLTIAPDDAETHFCLGMALLLKGDYRAGWPEYEWRRRMSDWGSTDQRALPMPLWRGEPLNGAPILLHAEQGLGDAIHFVRYATLVARRGGRVLLKVPASLHRLCSGLPGIERVVRDGEAVTAAWHCPLMSLPAAFGTEVATIPATPYLRADAAEAAAWAARLGPRLALRVGLVWAGAARFKRDQRRSLPLAAFGGLAALSGVEFYALQKGPAEKQLKNPPRGLKIHDLGADLGDFAATAAAINALDLVITVDTAVAHLAGAMGKPVWILLPFAPDWRWLTGRQDSPWYPTARLLRQPEPEDWRTVLARVAAELRQEAATAIFRR